MYPRAKGPRQTSPPPAVPRCVLLIILLSALSISPKPLDTSSLNRLRMTDPTADMGSPYRPIESPARKVLARLRLYTKHPGLSNSGYGRQRCRTNQIELQADFYRRLNFCAMPAKCDALAD